MSHGFGRLGALLSPALKDETALRAYVLRVTLVFVALAVIPAVVHDILFCHGREAPGHLAILTTLVAGITALPILWVMGRAHVELYRAKTALEELSRRDPLTGLSNRRAMVEEAVRVGGRTLVLAIADIDRFKSINDTYGHAAGDAVIIETGRIMSDELGDLGLVCRVGGEEFALVSGPLPAEMIRRRLTAFGRRVAATPVRHGDLVIPFTVSIGVAESGPGRSFTDVYTAADRALYVAKASGRDALCFDLDLERRLDPPLPPDEIVWSADEPVDNPSSSAVA